MSSANGRSRNISESRSGFSLWNSTGDLLHSRGYQDTGGCRAVQDYDDRQHSVHRNHATRRPVEVSASGQKRATPLFSTWARKMSYPAPLDKGSKSGVLMRLYPGPRLITKSTTVSRAGDYATPGASSEAAQQYSRVPYGHEQSVLSQSVLS